MSMAAFFLFSFLLLLALLHAHGGDTVIPQDSHPSCRDKCGSIPVKYPLGTGPGCGHPAFSPYLRCSDDADGARGAPHGAALYLTTRSGNYAVSGVDYPSATLTLADPLMSTCTAMQNSGGFALDPTAPFRLLPEDLFLLLGCSTSSPVFDPDAPLCDNAAARLCRGLYSCPSLAGLGLAPGGPSSTCCVYAPPRGVPSLGVDLPKLQCASYTCLRGFGDREGDPTKWKYGIALRFNDTYGTDACDGCEASAGACGFDAADGSFVCVCRSGVNTTTNCYGQGYAWNGSWKQGVEMKIGAIGIFLLWAVLVGS